MYSSPANKYSSKSCCFINSWILERLRHKTEYHITVFCIFNRAWYYSMATVLFYLDGITVHNVAFKNIFSSKVLLEQLWDKAVVWHICFAMLPSVQAQYSILSRCRIHCYVAAPSNCPLLSSSFLGQSRTFKFPTIKMSHRYISNEITL